MGFYVEDKKSCNRIYVPEPEGQDNLCRMVAYEMKMAGFIPDCRISLANGGDDFARYIDFYGGFRSAPKL